MMCAFYYGAFKARLFKLRSTGSIPDFVQSTRAHEARHGHLVLMRDVGLRLQILDQLSETEWNVD
jgi:hypothetical protein